MTTRKFLHAASIAVLAVICLAGEKLVAQSPEETLQLVVNYEEANEVRLPSQRGIVFPYLLLAGEAKSFTLQFPSSKAGYPVAISALDGGEVDGGSSQERVISSHGTIAFTFQPGQTLGEYRLVVMVPGEEHLLQFRVVNPLP
jgi:hypothetical protein